MYDNFPNLKSYFEALNVYLLGDLLVFDKNCKEADESDSYNRGCILGKTIVSLDPGKHIPYSSIYPQNMGSNPSAAYINNPFPRLAIPLALTLFSAIELMGILYTGRTDARSTTLNIKTFFEKLDPVDRPTNEEINTLIKVYRHGLVHQYFSKNQSFLSYSSRTPNRLFFQHETLCLNVNYLKNLCISGFEKIQADEKSFGIMESNVIKLNQIKII